jgi:hypothetical protein
MFFLGGLNSVLPYIIYLSLIWVFLIVGFGGKILQAKQFFTPKTYYAENTALQFYDSKVFHFYQHTAVTQNPTIQKSGIVFPWIYFFPVAFNLVQGEVKTALLFDSRFCDSFGYRGPPEMAFSI